MLYAMRLALILSFLFLSFSGVLAQNWTLTVKVDGAKSDKGKIYIAIYDKKDSYCETDKAVNGEIVGITAGRGMASFRVKEGCYSVVVFHDENDNGKLDRYFFGPPKEGYGFSNNVNSRKFEDALIEIKRDRDVNIKMKYL